MFGGWNRQYKHKSETLGCDMVFSVFYPPAAEKGPVPVRSAAARLLSCPYHARAHTAAPAQVLYYLSGLTCTDQNVITKGFPQHMAAQKGIAFVAPDTSPRGLGIEGEDESYDFGTGAGFYVNATEPKWKQYRMYDYIVKELPAVLGHLPNLDTKKAGSPAALERLWLGVPTQGCTDCVQGWTSTRAVVQQDKAAAKLLFRLCRQPSAGTPWAATAPWCWACATRSNTAALAPLRPSAIPATRPGARRRSRATWAATRRPGSSMTPPSWPRWV